MDEYSVHSDNNGMEDDDPCSMSQKIRHQKYASDYEYLTSLCERKDRLMTYGCKIKDRKGKALTDSGATRNYISKDYATKSNLRINKSNARSVKLPNGRTMRVLGLCEFELQLSEWTGLVRAIVLDEMQTDKFDLVLGLEWLKEVAPIPDWSTFDWFVYTPEGRILRIKHESKHFDVNSQIYKHPSFTALTDELDDLHFTLISEQEAKHDLQNGGIGILYHARTYRSTRTHRPISNYITVEDIDDAFYQMDLEKLDDPMIKSLLGEYPDIFIDELPSGLPPKRTIDHAIETGTARPTNKNPYPLSSQQLREQAKQVDDLLKRGLIQESVSPWGAPVLFVAKKTPGEWRMCIDYRALNTITFRNTYPLPRIQECIDRLGTATHLSSLDLTSGYWQVRIKDEDIPKTAFNTRYGKYEFLVMPFGLINAPATFQTLMNKILRPYIDKFVLVYLDDILIFSNSKEEHLQHLRLVFDALREAKLYVRSLKCVFNQSTVEFCGHIVGQGVVKVLESKVQTIRSWPVPKTVHEVRQFYGLVNYYRRFIRNFSIIGAPLSDLFKQADDNHKRNNKHQPVFWNIACQLAFDRLKEAITNAPVLKQPDETKSYIIETDSSDFGNGMILLQEGDDGRLHPVAFEGRKLKGAELRYPTHEKELLAIKEALEKWRIYVDNGMTITVITDHDSLKYMNTTKNSSKRLARWVEEFQAWPIDIKYRPGKYALVPDAISRRPDYFDYFNSIHYLDSITPRREEEYISYMSDYLKHKRLPDDDELRNRIIDEAPNFILIEPESTANNKNKHGILHRKIRDRITAPYIDFILRGDLIQSIHNEFGHLSYMSLENIFESRAWWPSMERDIRTFITACPNCQIQQRQRCTQEREHLQIVSDPAIQPFQRWGIDLIGILPRTKDGNRYIITAIDYATGWPVAKAIPEATQETIADFIFHEIYMHYGAPQEIFTDRGANLWGNVVQTYLKKIATLHYGTSPYHPRTNGKVERLNGILGGMLGKFLLGKPTKLWDLYLDQALFACRVRTHTTTKTSPFYLLYGKQPHLLGDINKALPTDTTPTAHDERLRLVQSARIEAARATYERALQNKKYRDDIVKPHTLEIGTWVLVRHEGPHKFEAKWYGPYQIIDKTLLGTYCLQDPNGRQLATLVHGNHLIDAKINDSIEKLEKLWASPRLKDMLRRENLKITYVPASPENTDILEQHMQEQVDIDEPALSPSTTGNPRDTKRNTATQDKHPSDNVQKPYDPIIRISLKRLREVEALDELLQPTKRARPNTT